MRVASCPCWGTYGRRPIRGPNRGMGVRLPKGARACSIQLSWKVRQSRQMSKKCARRGSSCELRFEIAEWCSSGEKLPRQHTAGRVNRVKSSWIHRSGAGARGIIRRGTMLPHGSHDISSSCGTCHPLHHAGEKTPCSHQQGQTLRLFIGNRYMMRPGGTLWT